MNAISATHTIDTPLGALHLQATDTALVSAVFDAPSSDLPANALCRDAEAQLAAYFAGRLRQFDLPLQPSGTAFQRQVWAGLGKVPWGQAITYGTLAETLGRPGGHRAVGAAVGRNPLALLIPCHRVLGANGRLTGFAWGLDRKQALLALEGIDAAA